MIQVTADTANEVWLATLKSLLEVGGETGNDKYSRDELLVAEIQSPRVEPADPQFPMKQADLDVINHFIHSGEDEGAVAHEWTKLYYHRAFDEPNSQIKFLIRNLNAERPVPEAQISIWDKMIDQDSKVTPCAQIIWARIKHGKLELHVHTNSTDAYKKLLMNLLEFISLQHHIADQVGLPVGTYYFIADSCHIYREDLLTATAAASR